MRRSAAVRILMPSIVDPATSRSGAGTVTRNLIRLLESPPLNASIECVSVAASTGLRHRARQATAVARSLWSTLPSKALYTHSRKLERRISSLVRQNDFDLAIINGSDLLWVAPLLPANSPCVLVAHNIEAALFASQVGYVSGLFPWLRLILSRELHRMETYEIEGIRRVSNVIFLSTVDQADTQASIASLNTIAVPPLFGSVIQPMPERSAGDTLELGFLGNLHWWPNREALDWFVDLVLPNLERPVMLHVFGEGRLRVDDPRIICHGPVPDVAQVWNSCDLMIVPTHSGGGVSIKLAEAMYHGMPCLSTSFATSGLPLTEQPALIVRDDAAEWVQFLNSLSVREVRRLRVTPETSRLFSLEANAECLQQYLQALLVREPSKHGGSSAKVAAEPI